MQRVSGDTATGVPPAGPSWQKGYTGWDKWRVKTDIPRTRQCLLKGNNEFGRIAVVGSYGVGD